MRGLLALCALMALAAGAADHKKKNPEDETQTLQLPQELPSAVSGATRRLAFHVTPLSVKGLLSPQVREALRALQRESGGEQVLQLRAFVAGSGDLRRVRDLVSEIFSERRLPLPALSLVRVGGLPANGAQVVLEAVSLAHKDINPHGLAWVAAQAAASSNPLDPVAPLAAQSIESLGKAVQAAGAAPSEVVRVTCFLSTLDGWESVRDSLLAAYPHAALNIVQAQREPVEALAACEAVARLDADPGVPLRLLNPAGLPDEPGASQIAQVNAPETILTGTQVSFGYTEGDGQMALGRLEKAAEQAGASLDGVAFVHYYPLSRSLAAQVRKLRGQFFAAARPPAGSMTLVEGLPSMDAGFAVDAVAVKTEPRP
jgi:enamine deaminase RidA (YjgF/YER057c/UK114 family)